MTSFEQLISPVSVDGFFSDYLERRPLVLRRKSPGYYRNLFSMEQMEEIAYREADLLLMEQLRTVRAGKSAPRSPRGESESVPLPDRGSVNASAWLRSVYRSGYTIVAGMNRANAALTRLLEQMRLLFQCEVHVNAYLSPPDAQGLPVHYDAHDTLILQIHGQKRWVLHGQSAYLPLERFSATSARVRTERSNRRTLLLRPGDLLYLPRGYMHEASTGVGASLHLTLGIVSYRWFELFGELFRQFALSEALLRERVPFAPDGTGPDARTVKTVLAQAARHLRQPDALDLVLDEHRRRVLSKSFVGHGIFSAKPDTVAIGLKTWVRRITPCQVSRHAGQARISFPGCEILGPASILPALRFIGAAKTEFAIAALPDALSPKAKLTLAIRLIDEGLLEVTASRRSRG